MGLREKLGKKFVITTELGPTDGTDVETALAKAKSYVRLDGINIHDCPMARLRINSVMLAHIVQQETGIDTIPHFTCRDRSLLGTQADLLGAHALGIRFLLPTTGDPPAHGPFPSTGVYDLKTLGLIELIKQMNKGFDSTGKEFKGPVDFTVSGTTSTAAANMEGVYRRVQSKIDAGADFFQTQPAYDPEKAIAFMEKMRTFGKPVIMGIMPLKGIKMAEYMNDHVDGIEIPAEVMSKIRAGSVTGAQLACDFIRQVYKHIDGIHVMALGDVQASNEIIEYTMSLVGD